MESLKPTPYNLSFGLHSRKQTVATIKTADESLPPIDPNDTVYKHNTIRNQLNSTRSQIMLMEAKLQNLRKIKTKFEQKRTQNMTKISFLNSVKQRAEFQARQKRKLQQQRQESQQLLKEQVQQLRQSLINQRKNAESTLRDSKAQEAEETRRKRKQHEYLLQKLKEMDMQAKEQRAEKIREFHQQSASRIRSFQESRVSLAKSNYQNKVISAVREKERANSTLKKMKEEEERLTLEVKNSEQTMLTSLYSLDAMNPEKKRRRFASSDRSLKYTNEVYCNDDFLS